MQRNCHEFIAYENLAGSRRSAERGRQSGPVAAQAPIEQAVPLVRRALKVLADREVSPQLGLLKSTLLQLDSTFSERNYGTGSFRDFAEKLAKAGHVTLRESGRNVLVELAERGNGADEGRSAQPQPAVQTSHRPHDDRDTPQEVASSNGSRAEPRTADGIREVRRLFQSSQNPPRWPMYIRQAKQFLRNVDTSFDERKYGFASLVDLMRACQREGLFRIERDRQGVMRLFPGNVMQPDAAAVDDDNRGNVTEPVAASATSEWSRDESPAEQEVVDGDVVQEMNAPAPVVDVDAQAVAPEVEEAAAERGAARKRGGRRAKAHPSPDVTASEEAQPQERAADRRGGRKDGKPPRARKTPSRPRAPRTRPQ